MGDVVGRGDAEGDGANDGAGDGAGDGASDGDVVGWAAPGRSGFGRVSLASAADEPKATTTAAATLSAIMHAVLFMWAVVSEARARG